MDETILEGVISVVLEREAYLRLKAEVARLKAEVEKWQDIAEQEAVRHTKAEVENERLRAARPSPPPPAPPKPRRMLGSLTSMEHDECVLCATAGCVPVDGTPELPEVETEYGGEMKRIEPNPHGTIDMYGSWQSPGDRPVCELASGVMYDDREYHRGFLPSEVGGAWSENRDGEQPVRAYQRKGKPIRTCTRRRS